MSSLLLNKVAASLPVSDTSLAFCLLSATWALSLKQHLHPVRVIVCLYVYVPRHAFAFQNLTCFHTLFAQCTPSLGQWRCKIVQLSLQGGKIKVSQVLL